MTWPRGRSKPEQRKEGSKLAPPRPPASPLFRPPQHLWRFQRKGVCSAPFFSPRMSNITTKSARRTVPKVGMISLGCAKNLVDAEIMLGDVLAHGMTITNDAA